MGRPSLLEQEGVRERILEAVRFGVPAAIAAEAAGVAPRTFHEWVQRGKGGHASRKADAQYAQFAQAVRVARAEAVSRFQLTHTKTALGQVVRREVRRVVMSEDGVHEELVEREFFPPNVMALQWYLERRVPDYYGAVVARDAETADPDEVMPPDAAADDPADAQDRIAGLLDRLAPAPPTGEAAAGGVPRAGGD